MNLPDRAFLDRRLETLATDSSREGSWTVVGVRAPTIAPRMIDALGDGDAVALAAPGEPLWIGLGCAHAITAEGQTRFASVQADARAFFDALSIEHAAKVDAIAPRLFGGLAFAPGAADDVMWRAFGDARFVLPRFTLVQREHGSTLWVAVRAGDDVVAIRAGLDALDDAFSRAVFAASDDADLARVGGEPFEAYRARIEAITAAIGAGTVEKVVAARRVRVESARNLDVGDAFTRLCERFGGCARFAFRVDGTTFLGATPERLVRRSGTRVDTVALAGTVARGETRALLQSAKDAREHSLVVDAIAEALDPFATLDPIPAAPVVRELPNVVHMQTPIEGSLNADVHALALAEALHPTPAVGGVPQADAVEWISAHEAPRGWYSSPVGSFCATGEGEFFVALRCGLIRGARADAYAGGGIVAGSEAAAEFAETELKLSPFVNALRPPARADERPPRATTTAAAHAR